MLEATNDNILREKLFCVLTSSEMVALSRVMAIVHFKIALPMRWLAGSTHIIGALGYDWSARSMGKAIDALHDALVKIEDNGELFLDEQFMTDIFSKIDEDEQGKRQPLEPLKEAMEYYMGE